MSRERGYEQGAGLAGGGLRGEEGGDIDEQGEGIRARGGGWRGGSGASPRVMLQATAILPGTRPGTSLWGEALETSEDTP